MKKVKREEVVLLGVATPSVPIEKLNEHLNELEFLAETAGAITKARFTQNLEFPNPKTYFGTGKLIEVNSFIKSKDIETVIIDDELSPAQLRNLEKFLDCKVLDRTNLILDIFASRAQTSQAKTQVDLAQMEYLLPRLTKMWTHLSRQKGGIGMKGPGEKEIETDRRIIRTRIGLLKEKLRKIDTQSSVRRKSRSGKIRIALVGYTNAGKSTLMNKLNDESVLAENKLFSTLDTTVRKVSFNNVPVLLSDTVGFIRKLPIALIESFKSTLSEAVEADILLHVVDVSHPSYLDHINVVNDTIKELGADNKMVITVFNKIDLWYQDHEEPPQTSNIDNLGQKVFISSEKNINIGTLRNLIGSLAANLYNERYPYHQYIEPALEANNIEE